MSSLPLPSSLHSLLLLIEGLQCSLNANDNYLTHPLVVGCSSTVIIWNLRRKETLGGCSKLNISPSLDRFYRDSVALSDSYT